MPSIDVVLREAFAALSNVIKPLLEEYVSRA